jgi:hypothetical protein
LIRLRHDAGYDGYICIACPYQFWVFREVPYQSLEPTLMAVWLPPDAGHGIDYAAIVAGHNSFRGSLQWDAGTAAAAVNGGFSRFITWDDWDGTAPGLYLIRCPWPLLHWDGKNVAETAWIGAPHSAADLRSVSGQAKIVGVLWDAMVIHSTDFALDSRARFGDLGFQCVGRQRPGSGSTVATLWVAYDVAVDH